MTLYIDLTTSVRWRRPPVGIVRVEREFARHCLLHEPGTVFCEIDGAGEYRVIEPRQAQVILDDAWCRAEPVAAIGAPAPAAAPPAARSRVQRMFDWLAARGPKLVPAAAYPLLRDLGKVLADHHAAFERHRAAKRALREAASTTVEPAQAQAPTPAPAAAQRIEPTPRDTFFSIGLQWHHGALHAWHLRQRTGVRVVEACYDTIPIDYPEYAGSAKQPFSEHFTTIAHTADVVFAISDTSAADLAAFYRRVGLWDVPPIRTVHLATPEVHRDADVDALAADERAALEALAPDDYVLYVSTFETRKNHRLLLQVWKDLHRRRGDACPRLVVVGMFGWGVNELWAEMQASEVWEAGRIVMLHHVSDALLAHLYRGCVFTVFPSIYEGWGLAATESLAYGKLAIVSDAPALREATQGLCPAIHPFDFPRWYEAITHYLDDASARAGAESRIRAEYVPRHWRDFALDLLAATRAGT